MITGFITTAEVAAQIAAGVAHAFHVRNLPQFWALATMPIHSGPNAGLTLIAADDEIISAPLRGNPVLTPTDFPEFGELVVMLGGLESRVQIDPSNLIDPNAEKLP